MNITDIASKLKPINIDPKMILLDTKNPRFAGEDFPIAKDADPIDEKLQDRMRKFIVDRFSVQDIIDSVEKIGFFKLDRIVVTEYKSPGTKSARKKQKDDKHYIVLEGNRRVAAIKTLLQSYDKKEIALTKEVLQTLNKIEALYLDIKDEKEHQQATWFLQGIRHVSGIRDWGPYQQAELIHTLTTEQKMNFTDAGKAIGAGRKRAANMLRAYKGLKQMESDPTYGDKAKPDLFSHFEQAYVKTPVRDWLGWDESQLKYSNANALQKFYKWVTEDNPDIGQKKIQAQEVRDQLSKVLQSENARNKFTSEDVNLEKAYGMACAEDAPITNISDIVQQSIKNITKIPWTYKPTEEDIKLMQQLIETIKEYLDKLK